MNILLVEDDNLLGESARIGLGQRGLNINWVSTLERASRSVHNEDVDCMLLDLSLPDGDGLKYLKRLRDKGVTLPIIVITARHALDDRIKGLEYGADDYIVKPYSLDEVAARIQAVVRRAEGRASNVLKAGSLCFDPNAGVVSKNGEPVVLSATELRLLSVLMQHAGKIRTREQLLHALTGNEDQENVSNVLDVHIHHLRKKLGADLIKTVRGLGYMLMKEESST